MRASPYFVRTVVGIHSVIRVYRGSRVCGVAIDQQYLRLITHDRTFCIARDKTVSAIEQADRLAASWLSRKR